MGTATMIRHPRDLRAIPNNAILQQLGWMANTLQGLGAAAGAASRDVPRDARAPAAASAARSISPRTRWRIPTSTCCARWSARSIPAPGSTAPPTPAGPGRREALVAVAQALERLDLWAAVQSMFRRVQADHLALRAAWPDAPRMAAREMLLHALRLALIHRIWLLATAHSGFLAAPRR